MVTHFQDNGVNNKTLVSPNFSESHLSKCLISMACTLDQLCSQSNGHAKIAPEPSLATFSGSKTPSIDTFSYICRLRSFMKCSSSCFVTSLIYIDRLITLRQSLTVNPLTLHRLIFTALVISCKYWDDQYYTNKFYSKVGGVTLKELNSLECSFLFNIQFALDVKPQDFAQYREQLMSHQETSGCLTHNKMKTPKEFCADTPSGETDTNCSRHLPDSPVKKKTSFVRVSESGEETTGQLIGFTAALDTKSVEIQPESNAKVENHKTELESAQGRLRSLDICRSECPLTAEALGSSSSKIRKRHNSCCGHDKENKRDVDRAYSGCHKRQKSFETQTSSCWQKSNPIFDPVLDIPMRSTPEFAVLC
mmetsp:Transcript_10188/g.19296  ORF Transcript_10188/g.19296 Transcript_10188/m.19296 type:complete len:364 (-) Transcript_10188:81-1172(-)